MNRYYVCVYYMVKYIAEDINMRYNELVHQLFSVKHTGKRIRKSRVFFALFAVALS